MRKVIILFSIILYIIFPCMLFTQTVLDTIQYCPGEEGMVECLIYENPNHVSLNYFKSNEAEFKYPDQVEILSSLKSQENSNDWYVAKLRGYIEAPETGAFLFNITGDNKTEFWLSEDESFEKLDLLARTINLSYSDEHDRYEEQTSKPIFLEQGRKYFFEVFLWEKTGWDHVTVFWKTPNEIANSGNWQVISEENLFLPYCLQQTCPPPNTPCDDQNPDTENDVEDGDCNCAGTPIPNEADGCIGEEGKVQWLAFHDLRGEDLGTLQYLPQYPNAPDRFELLESISSPQRYNDHYAGLVRGFIRPLETGQYIFNITGDDNSQFWLSTNEEPANLSKVAEVPGWTGVEEYEKYPEQTTGPITLEEGRYYYFEALNKEGGGGDFVQVQWQTPIDINNDHPFHVIGEQYLFAPTCLEVCPERGTPCDDQNPNTINDQEDGNCNCFGVPTSSTEDDCIGDRGTLRVLYYNAPTGGLDDIHTCEDYPMKPMRVEFINNFNGPITNADNYFTRARGYLYIPVTGNYEFAITGNNQLSFMMASLDNIENPQTIVYTEDYTDEFEFDKEASQQSGSIFLEAGTFYYIELLHRETWGGDYYNVFWKTPFDEHEEWKILNGSYLFQYNCEEACIPEGTKCDDGDPNTFDDVYDENCNCVGTPCVDGDCSNNPNVFSAFQGCNAPYLPSQGISRDNKDAWLSCEKSDNPNAERGESHWIRYDLGKIVALESVQIWNYFVENEVFISQNGLTAFSIDYSVDGLNWSELLTTDISKPTQLTSDEIYNGLLLDQFNYTPIRYLLITSLYEHTPNDCVGFSKINLKVSDCSDPNCSNVQIAKQAALPAKVLNGKTNYSNGLNLNISPNPARDYADLSFTVDAPSTIKIGLYNAAGALVQWIIKDQSYPIGTFETPIPVASLSAGVYTVSLFGSDKVLTEKLVKID